MDEEIRCARAYLSRVAEAPAPALAGLIRDVGPVQAAAMVRAGDTPADVAAETAPRRHHDWVEEDLAAADALGARIVCPEDPEWPSSALSSLEAAYLRGFTWACPPIALWVRGGRSLAEVVDRSVAIVGSRAATPYGEHVAADFAYGVAGAGVSVVSGAAYGIDGAAHRGALACPGVTVAVLACGVDVPYPSGHARLLGQIAEHGLVISQYPPRMIPAKHRFLARNRLTAAMTAATVVVESGVRGGTRYTAALATALGKPVLAVPGPITSATSTGCHTLIRGGSATLAESAADVLRTVDPHAGRAATPEPGVALWRVYDALDDVETTAEQLAITTGVPDERVRAVLADLAMIRSAERGPTGWRRT